MCFSPKISNTSYTFVKIKMKIKVTKDLIDIASNSIHLCLTYKLWSSSNGKDLVVYEPSGVQNLFELIFNFKPELDVNLVLFPGLFKTIEGTLFVSDLGVKHIFSSFFGFHSTKSKNADEIKKNIAFSKFSLQLLSTDLDSYVLKSHDLPTDEFTQNFCSAFSINANSKTSGLKVEKANNLVKKYEAINEMNEKSQKAFRVAPKYLDSDYLCNLQILLEVAGGVLRQLVDLDNVVELARSKLSQDNVGLKLTEYDPSKDLCDSTSAPVLSFLEALSKPHVTDLAKVCLRNAIWEAGQEKNERYKPIAMYYLAEILKCLEDKKKILAITCQVGLTVSYKGQSINYVTHFWHFLTPPLHVVTSCNT